jgi:hypothetical protein
MASEAVSVSGAKMMMSGLSLYHNKINATVCTAALGGGVVSNGTILGFFA